MEEIPESSVKRIAELHELAGEEGSTVNPESEVGLRLFLRALAPREAHIFLRDDGNFSAMIEGNGARMSLGFSEKYILEGTVIPTVPDTGMVERIALIIARHADAFLPGGDPSTDTTRADYSAGEWSKAREAARAVLECLRTPTPEMVEAMQDSVSGFPRIADCYAMFNAAIDRALSPSKGEGE